MRKLIAAMNMTLDGFCNPLLCLVIYKIKNVQSLSGDYISGSALKS